jgi:hypothetical protein
VFQCSVGGFILIGLHGPLDRLWYHRSAYKIFLVNLQGLLFFHTVTGVFLVHIFSVFHRASLVHITEFSQTISLSFTNTEIHMVLDIPQGDPVPISRHC